MRAQDLYAKTPSRSDPHNLPRSQPYTVSQALRRLGNSPRNEITKNPSVQGFPHINASPRIDATPTARPTYPPRPGDPSARADIGGQDPRHHKDKPGFQRQRTGGLFVEASDSSPPPPPDFSPQSLAGLYSRALFSSNHENYPYSEEEFSRKDSKGKRRSCHLFSVAMWSDKEEVGQGSVEKTPTLGQKAKRHCMRWWWVYLLIFVCIVVLVVCLV